MPRIMDLLSRNRSYLVSVSMKKGKAKGFSSFTVNTNVSLYKYKNISEMIKKYKKEQELDEVVILNIIKIKM